MCVMLILFCFPETVSGGKCFTAAWNPDERDCEGNGCNNKLHWYPSSDDNMGNYDR